MCGFIMVSYDSKKEIQASYGNLSPIGDLRCWPNILNFSTSRYHSELVYQPSSRKTVLCSLQNLLSGLGIRFQISSQHLTWQYNRFFSLFPHAQVYRMCFLSFCGIVLWRRPSVTWRVIQRASYYAATMTAGAAAPQSSLIVTAPSQTSKPWRRVCVRAKSPGPTSTMTSWTQVG